MSSGASSSIDYDSFFKKATSKSDETEGYNPYPFQRRLALSGQLPELIDVPTGLGKTDGVVLGWLWRRRFDPRPEVRAATPRRLVYCLPMRVLVEQTTDKARKWLKNLGLLADRAGDDQGVEGWAKQHGDCGKRIAVTVLMGGEDKDDWDLYPERDAIIIGTQDMLLSRALNRGYGMSRYRWPVHFGLLNNDCLWVMDEVQLMGVGVETSAQIHAFCKSFGTMYDIHHIWMSATIGEGQLDTVDNPRPSDGRSRLSLTDEDKTLPEVSKRLEAKKTFRKSTMSLSKENEKMNYAREFANIILDRHKPESLTLVVVNRVQRAQEIYIELIKRGRTNENTAVLHSRFRKPDREKGMKILSEENDRIIVATQVVEAGVDISARTLITELAPWASLVQRIGRCNRKGEHEDAIVEWLDIDTNDDGLCYPYDNSSLEAARSQAKRLDGTYASPKALKALYFDEPLKIRPVLRRKDILDLFDTTPDLTGNDLDVSHYIRDGEDKDVQVYWREMADEDMPNDNSNKVMREELCSVSISQINNFLKKFKDGAWIWDNLDGRWKVIGNCRPGQVILLHPKNGGYNTTLGWRGLEESSRVTSISVLNYDKNRSGTNTMMDQDDESAIGRWISLLEHSNDVMRSINELSEALCLPQKWRNSLGMAAKKHDLGKLHPAFQNMLISSRRSGEPMPSGGPWAKSKSDKNFIRPIYWIESEQGEKIIRKYFRHELASALSWIQTDGHHRDDGILVAYLIAAHHGKIRMSIRSLPKEIEPPEKNRFFARGIWDGDVLPANDGILDKSVRLDLSIMQMGEDSWLERMLRLRDDPLIGPLRLAFLETILRIADWRASSIERGAID